MLAALSSLDPPALCDLSFPDPLPLPPTSPTALVSLPIPTYDTAHIDLNATRPSSHLAELFPPADSLNRLATAFSLDHYSLDEDTRLERLEPLPWPCWSCEKPAGATDIFEADLESKTLFSMGLPPWESDAREATDRRAWIETLFPVVEEEEEDSLHVTRRNTFLAFSQFYAAQQESSVVEWIRNDLFQIRFLPPGTVPISQQVIPDPDLALDLTLKLG